MEAEREDREDRDREEEEEDKENVELPAENAQINSRSDSKR